MMSIKLQELSFLTIFILVITSACQSVQTKTEYKNDLVFHWYHFSEKDRGDTLVFVHDMDLKVVRGGRVNFELFKDGTMTYEEAMNNDEPLMKKGKWMCENDKNTLTFNVDNLTNNYLIVSLKNNRLELKQMN